MPIFAKKQISGMILNTNVKLNLGLNVLRKRPDGYHDIETLFVPYLEMGDILEVITGDDYSRTSAALFGKYGDSVVQGISGDGKLMVTIASEEAIGWDPMEDLCAKAYQALAKDFDMPPVKIFLEKKVPVGAGLGGGSADAAFTLKSADWGLQRKGSPPMHHPSGATAPSSSGTVRCSAPDAEKCWSLSTSTFPAMTSRCLPRAGYRCPRRKLTGA